MRLKLLATALTSLLVLTACNGKSDTPTASPTASPSVAASPSPEASNKTPDVVASPTGKQKFQEVKVDNLKSYKHPSGLFNIEVPSDWKLTDSSKPGEVIQLWQDSAQNALIVVDILKTSQKQDSKQLGEKLQAFLKSSLGSEADFEAKAPVDQPDGSVRVTWSYTATADNGAKGPVTGNSFIQQEGDKISVLTTGMPQEQYQKLEKPMLQVINSFKVNADKSVP